MTVRKVPTAGCFNSFKEKDLLCSSEQGMCHVILQLFSHCTTGLPPSPCSFGLTGLTLPVIGNFLDLKVCIGGGGGGGGRGYEWVGVSMWCSVCTLATTNAIHCPSGELCSLSLSRCCLSPRSSLLGSALQTSGAQGVFPVGLCGTAAGDVS